MVTVVAAVVDPDPTRGTKTLEAYLVTPTAHKQRRLDQSLESYTTLLKRSFDAGCTTRSAVNDIVSGEDLNWQSKDALKNYVPQLLDKEVYGASALADAHPIRYTNRAAKFDIDHQRHHSVCWEVPQPGAQSNNFWIPLHHNPDQEADWHVLLDEESDVEPGELRLQRDGTRWMLHVTVRYPKDDVTDLPAEPTYIGLDIGETALLTG